MPGQVHIHDDGAVRVVTLSHPEKKNALTLDMLAELSPAFRATDAHPRALVLVGDPAGAAFSAGFDLSAIDGAKAGGLDPIDAPAQAIARCPVPVIAAIDGPCMGGALDLAAACTLRVASPRARLRMPATRLGLVYGSAGLGRMIAAFGRQQTLRLFLTAETVSGDALRARGLVDVLDDAPLDAARALADAIAAGAPLAVRGTLQAVRVLSRPAQISVAQADLLRRARRRALHSADLARGLDAIAQKRPPRFEGN